MTMKISAVLPFDRIECGTEFVSPEAVKEISTLLERLGFDGCSVTDHPCPTGRWLDAGGHFAQDPFVMLSLVAAHTTRLRLQTGILVLPYRNPFITARAVATLDVFSKGRVSLGVGAGYLKGEYRALGIDFEQRNEIMDEYLKALKAAWCHDEFTFEGTGYKAQGNRILPRPLQQPHPPLWIGGNSKRAIRRAVELGDAWNPFFTTGALTTTSRTLDMTGEADLAEGIAYLKAQSEQTGRAKPPAIILGNLFAPGEPSTAAALVDRLGACAALGVTGAATHIEGNSRAAWCDNAERFAKEVMAKLP